MFVCLFVVFRNTEGKPILQTFIESGLHAIPGHYAKWPKSSTIIVCLIEYSTLLNNPYQIVTKWNISGSHAELRLIKWIKDNTDLTKIKSITIYINHSPCIDCSGKLMEELKQNVHDLQVKFTSFYDIQRPSCKRSNCCKRDVPGTFGKLIELGALPFKEEDWDILIYLLIRNDGLNKHPESNLHLLRYGDENRDWRNGEDKKMMDDYNELNTPTPPGGAQVGDLADNIQHVSLGD